MPSYDNMLHEHITNDDVEVFNATKHVESKGAAAPGCEYFLFNLSDDFLGYIGVTTLGKLHNEHKMRGVIAKRASHQDDDGRWELVSSAVAPIKTKDIYIILGPHSADEFEFLCEGGTLKENPVEVIYTWHPGLPTPLPSSNGITDATTVKLMGKEDAFSHLSNEKKTPPFKEWLNQPHNDDWTATAKRQWEAEVRESREKENKMTFDEWLDQPHIKAEGKIWGKMAEKAGLYKDGDDK